MQTSWEINRAPHTDSNPYAIKYFIYHTCSTQNFSVLPIYRFALFAVLSVFAVRSLTAVAVAVAADPQNRVSV